MAEKVATSGRLQRSIYIKKLDPPPNTECIRRPSTRAPSARTLLSCTIGGIIGRYRPPYHGSSRHIHSQIHDTHVVKKTHKNKYQKHGNSDLMLNFKFLILSTTLRLGKSISTSKTQIQSEIGKTNLNLTNQISTSSSTIESQSQKN